MSIAEKLTTIAENEQKVYDKGVEDGNIIKYATSWEYMFYAGARNHLLPYIKYNDTENVTNMKSAFYKNDSVNEIPIVNTSKVIDFYYFCNGAKTLQSVPDLDYSKAENMSCAFQNCKKLKKVSDLDLNNADTVSYLFAGCEGLNRVERIQARKATNTKSMFYNCPYVVTIAALDISGSDDGASMFYYCANLKNITFEGSIKAKYLNFSYSELLTYESIMGIINALIDRSEETTAQNITFGTVNLGKLTDAEKAIATEKGWTLV